MCLHAGYSPIGDENTYGLGQGAPRGVPLHRSAPFQVRKKLPLFFPPLFFRSPAHDFFRSPIGEGTCTLHKYTPADSCPLFFSIGLSEFCGRSRNDHPLGISSSSSSFCLNAARAHLFTSSPLPPPFPSFLSRLICDVISFNQSSQHEQFKNTEHAANLFALKELGTQQHTDESHFFFF